MENIYARAKSFFALSLFILFAGITVAQPPTISYVEGFGVANAPVEVVNAGDGSNRLFVVEQNGFIEVRNGTTLTQFANFGSTGLNIITSGGEQGLLSMAFHPDYNGTTNRFYFIYYTDLSGNIAVSRMQTTAGNPNTTDNSSLLNFITIPHPGESNHNGGHLQFGSDGYLYFATGDGGGGNDPNNNAQNGNSLLGKMLRIDINEPSLQYVNYSVPPTNPYISDPAVDDRIWALGLRNPFRWSFDRLTGDMWIGDVGQAAQEEVNFRPAGGTGAVNYGWRCYEGYISTPSVPDCVPTAYVPPVFDYPNPNPGGSAVTGGFVYRGTEYPTFPGYYVSTDVYSGDIYILWPNGLGGFDSATQASPINYIVGYGEAEDGTLYAVSQATNTVYKVAAAGGVVLPMALEGFNGIAYEGYNQLTWNTTFEQNTARFHIEFSNNNASYERAGTVTATRNPLGAQYSFRHQTDNRADIYYRLAIIDDNALTKYSSVIRVRGTKSSRISIFPTLLRNSTLNFDSQNREIEAIRLVNMNGATMFQKNVNNAGKFSIQLPTLAKGMYLLEMSGKGFTQREKIMVQ